MMPLSDANMIQALCVMVFTLALFAGYGIGHYHGYTEGYRNGRESRENDHQ